MLKIQNKPGIFNLVTMDSKCERIHISLT